MKPKDSKAIRLSGVLLLLAFILNCSANPNSEFIKIQNSPSKEKYEQFVKDFPESPQTLKAKIALEKYNPEISKSIYKWSSEKDIQVLKENGRFKDSNSHLKEVFDSYKSNFKRNYFEGEGGFKIAYDYYEVKGATRAILLSHGTGESSIRYAEVVYDWIQNKIPYSIFVINHRGFGYSERLLGKYRSYNPKWDVYDVKEKDFLEYRKIHANEFGDYVKDLDKLVDLIHNEHSIPMITGVGHSLGGGVLIQYAGLHPKKLNRLILSAPMASINGAMGADNYDFVSKALISIGDTFSHEGYTFGGENFNHLVTPFDTEENTLNFYTTSENRFFMKKYIIQEFPETSLGGLTWGFADAIYEGVKDIRSSAEKIEIPTTIFQAGNDDYVHPSGQEKVCSTMNENKKGSCNLIRIENSKHEFFLERDSIRNRVMDKIMDILLKEEN